MHFYAYHIQYNINEFTDELAAALLNHLLVEQLHIFQFNSIIKLVRFILIIVSEILFSLQA